MVSLHKQAHDLSQARDAAWDFSPTKPGMPQEGSLNPTTALPLQKSTHGEVVHEGAIGYTGNAKSEKGSQDSLVEMARAMSQRSDALHLQCPLPNQSVQNQVSLSISSPVSLTSITEAC